MRFKLLAVALMIGAVAMLLSPSYGQQPYRSGMQKKGKGGGFWLVVELEERSTIPRLVRFDDLTRPRGVPPLTIPNCRLMSPQPSAMCQWV